MKSLLILFSVILFTGCATKVNEYQLYVEQTAKIIQATNASEAACMLVVAEGVKSADAATKIAIATQIDRCKKQTPQIQPPKKGLFGF